MWTESPFSMAEDRLEDDHILHLDDLIEPHAYHDTPSPCTSSSQISSPQPHAAQLRAQIVQLQPLRPSSPSTSITVSSPNTGIALTKPIPPPATLPRKPDPASLNNLVVHPPKESCFNFPLVFPSIPENGAKSRVETQVRVTVDLAVPSSFTELYKYDRVGSWKWLRLPPGTATKRRTRKQGKIDPAPQDMLYLSAYVTCASPPHNQVFSCTSCQTREAKRVAKKLAARVRPTRSDTDSNEDPSRPAGKNKHHEDTTSIIQFNCAEVLDFSTGSVVLPLRITCYCRHHREKVGFLVNMQMLDNAGRVVAFGQTKPIMITDDHKTAALHSKAVDFNGDVNWSQMTTSMYSGSGADGRRSGRRSKDPQCLHAKKRRPKPYDSESKPSRFSREGSISSLPSPSTPYSQLPGTRSPTPPYALSHFLTPNTSTSFTALRDPAAGSSCSSPDRLTPNLSKNLDTFPDGDVLNGLSNTQQSIYVPEIGQATIPSTTPAAEVSNVVIPHPMPLMFFDTIGALRPVASCAPTIHRLIPNTGPTHGGIEVTVLGANFHAAEQLNCMFGGIPASSTQRWSDNALVCILPPRNVPGVVAVWIDKYQDEQTNAATSLFTYSDETDRTLMELALQVVGLKMTGKIEDAKDVAMRIVGSAGEETESQTADSSSMMQLAPTNSTCIREILPLLLNRGRDTENFESLIVNFLALLDTPLDGIAPNSMQTINAISHSSNTGQTLLHYAALLGFDSLTKFLVCHNVDLDARDRNGYTALHFAAISGSVNYTRTLLEAGADREIVNALGKTPIEVAQTNVLDILRAPYSDSDDDYYSSSDEDAAWGDGEEDAEPRIPRRTIKRPSRRVFKCGATLDVRKLPLASSSNTSSLTAVLSSFDKTQTHPPETESEKAEVDAKQTAWLTEVLQRTLAQLQAPQGIISNIPQIPLPHLPDLRNVPWSSLPQIPLVFPIFVPMPGWPTFLQSHSSDSKDQDRNEDTGKGMSAGALRTAQELRAILEKWIAMAAAATTNQQQAQGQRLDDTPPPKYTPRAVMEATPKASTSGSTASATQIAGISGDQAETDVPHPVGASEIRPVDHRRVQLTDQEVNAYTYAPSMKQTRKLQKKRKFK
ncbi:hypothetical protein AX15_006495 [Amanita polypyramis BW_CC]|nr:hypothetical protein AX15_006495 [Amanita polypyramis BW_CC]